MKRTYISLAVALGLGATMIGFFPYLALTPGTLSRGHLAQMNDCFSCHALLAGAPAAKCMVCHRPGEIGLGSVNGKPMARPNSRTQLIHRVVAGECSRCHTEHGDRFGANATRRFSHELLPKGIAAGCVACHAPQRPADALHTAATGECSPCHGTKGWKPATYDHDRLFRFDRHHPPRCADCHRPGDSLKEYTCMGCHEHSLDRMQREHQKEGITNIDRCRRCHPSGDEHDTIDEGGQGRQRSRSKDDDEND